MVSSSPPLGPLAAAPASGSVLLACLREFPCQSVLLGTTAGVAWLRSQRTLLRCERRTVNEAGASSDRIGHLFMVPLLLFLLATKTWWREGLPGVAGAMAGCNERGPQSMHAGAMAASQLCGSEPSAMLHSRSPRPLAMHPSLSAGLALQGSTFALSCAALAWLSGHKGWGRRLYVAKRELLILASCLHLQWVVQLTGERAAAAAARRTASLPRCLCAVATMPLRCLATESVPCLRAASKVAEL